MKDGNTNLKMMQIDGIDIEWVRKRVKNVNLSIRPPLGTVHVSTPSQMREAQVRQLLKTRLAWIQAKQALVRARPQPPQYQWQTGERHFVWGEAWPLQVVNKMARPSVALLAGHLVLQVRPNSTVAKRQQLIEGWYRQQMKVAIADLVAQWEPIIGVTVNEFRVKKMKTRWGSCNIQKRRIWLSLSLGQRPFICLEHVVVHEMVHLLERYHNKRFYRFMDQFLPDWRQRQTLLMGGGQVATAID